MTVITCIHQLKKMCLNVENKGVDKIISLGNSLPVLKTRN